MNCPSCDSSRFFYVQRVYEYHAIDSVSDGNIDLSHLDDAAFDEGYTPHLYCDYCGKTFDLYLNEFDLLEKDEPCLPDKFEVMRED